jgi:hypothetical protein
LGNYVYEHGGTISFIVVAFCITALVLIQIVVSAWKETKMIKTGMMPREKKSTKAFETEDTEKATEKFKLLNMG